MALKGPVWYRKTEKFLLDARPLLYLGLIALIVISAYFLWEVAHGRKVVPAALWVTYMWMP